jgi:hypothetical protein
MPLIRLSSRLTFAYKVLIPVGTLLGWLGYVGLLIWREWPLELHGVVAGFLLFMWVLFTLTAVRLRHICYDVNTVRIRNYGRWMMLPATRAVDFKASPLIPLRYLRTPTRNFYFLPSFTDTFAGALRENPVLSGFPEPASITRAHAVLRHPLVSEATPLPPLP